MARLTISDDWWTAPAEGENGSLILVTGRRSMDNVIQTGLYNYRIEITWPYQGDAKGLPNYADSKVMEHLPAQVQRGDGPLPCPAPAV